MPEESETATTDQNETPQTAHDSEILAAMEAKMPATPETEVTDQNEASTANDNESNREDQASATREQLFEQCGEIASSEDVLKLFAERLHDSGLAGEEAHAKLLYLILHTRFFEHIASAIIKGQSGGGKSYLLDNVLKFVPANATVIRSGMSPMAIVHGKEDLQHKHLVIYEYAGLKGAKGSPHLRILLSEGQIRYEVTVEKNGGYQTETVERKGPTGLLMTTTATAIHAEDENRMLSIEVDDSVEQTLRVLEAQAREAAGEVVENSTNLGEWHAFSDWLAMGNKEVLVPFALALVTEDAARSTRIKRDFKQVLALVKAHALLHQASREADDEGCILASLADYAAVRALVEPIVSEAVHATVRPEIRELVQEVVRFFVPESEAENAILRSTLDDTIHIAGVPQKVLAESLGVSESTISRRVEAAIGDGYIANDEKRPGRQARLVPQNPLPEDRKVLPTVEEVEERLAEMSAQQSETG